MNNDEDEYPIIWYQPRKDFTLKVKIKKQENLHLLSEFEEAVIFAKSLESSFLLIVPSDFDEKHLKTSSKDFYARRLADFEEEPILQDLGISEPFKIYVLYTDEDFDSEVFVENDAMKWDVREAAGDFREELIFWERKRRGLENSDAVFERSEEPQRFHDLWGLCDLWEVGEQEESCYECKIFCIQNLKKMVRKRKHEKMKLIYYVNIGECWCKLREYTKALDYFAKANDIVGQVYGEGHPNIANIYEGFANIHFGMKDYEKSIEYELKALEIRESIGDSNLGLLYENLAFLYTCSGEYEKVVECYLKVIEIKKSLDENLTCVYENLAKTYKNLKDQQREPQKKIEYFLKFIEIQELIDGEEHVYIASLLGSLGLLYSDSKQYEEAIDCYLKAIKIREAKFGLFYHTVIDLHHNIKTAYIGLQDFSKALKYAFKILKMEKWSKGEVSRGVASSYYEISKVFMENLCDYKNARIYLLKTLAIYKSILLITPWVRILFLSDINRANDGLSKCQKMIEANVKIYDILM